MSTNTRFRESVPANSTITVELGSLRSIPMPGGRVSMYAIGAVDGAIRATLMLGSDTILSRGFLSPPAVAGRLAVPDDLVATGIGVGGDPVVLTLENTTAGAIVAQGLLTLD